jgi:hypothetical protein
MAGRTFDYRTITGLQGRTADLKPRNYNWLARLESERSKVQDYNRTEGQDLGLETKKL